MINFTNHEIKNEFPVLKTIKSFLTAGLVDYADVDDGKYLLRKETIERMLPTLEGRPLVIGHQNVTAENVEDVAVGYITKGWFNTETGDFDCEVLVKDSSILDPTNCACSCAYIPTEMGDGGRYSGIEYDAEILNGSFTHIAIVDTPRYNDAKLLVNNFKLKGNEMLGRFFKNSEKQNELEVSMSDTVEIAGKEYSMKEICNALAKYNEDEEEKVNEGEEEKENEDKEPKDNEEEEKENNCGKRNEDEEEKDNEDDFEKRVEEVIANYMKKNASKKNEDKEEEKDNEDEDEVKEAKEKSNSLSVVARLRNTKQEPFSYETRAERIKASNEKYSK